MLKIENLELSAMTAAHARELWDFIVSDRKHPRRGGGWPGFDDFSKVEAYASEPSDFVYLIKSEDRLIGTIHIFNFTPVEAEVGYSVHHAAEGRGVIHTALRGLLAEFKTLGLKQTRITCPAWNKRSSAVAERAGFQFLSQKHADKECAGCDDCTKSYVRRL